VYTSPYRYRYHHVRPYHGVFVYGPRPVHHHHYVQEERPVEVPPQQMPERKVDRDNTLAVGIRGGSVFSGYEDAKPFADAGFGVNARYRPEESVGLELAVSTYKQDFSEENDRTITTGQASVELFAWPWTKVSPYAIGGLTVAGREFEDDRLSVATDRVETLSAKDVQWGPHVGLGVEFALGKSVALDLEARYVGFIGQNSDDPRLPGAMQTSAGVVVHF
jgi:opacity protein-like surface antigen